MSNNNNRNILPTRRSRRVRGATQHVPSTNSSISLPSANDTPAPQSPSLPTTQTTASTHPPPQSSLLLRMLPPEIRVRIWSFVVVSDDLIEPNIDTNHKVKTVRIAGTRFLSLPAERNRLALVRTCSVIQNEVLPIYHGDNTFRFANTWEMHCYLSSIDPRARALIKSIVFVWANYYRSSKQAFEVLRDCTSLHTIKAYESGDNSPVRRLGNHNTRDIWKTHGLATLKSLRVKDPSNFKFTFIKPTESHEIEAGRQRFQKSHKLSVTYGFFTKEEMKTLEEMLNKAIKKEAVNPKRQAMMEATTELFEGFRSSKRLRQKQLEGNKTMNEA